MASDEAPPAPAKLRAIVFGEGIGMFPPLMQRFKEEFEIVATFRPRLPAAYTLACLLFTIRWPRHVWYRRWMHYLEKTPTAFRMLTRSSHRELRAWEGKYDVILFMGAMYAPSLKVTRPLFIFTDSCRWLSARNVHDSISHFRNAREESEWLALESAVYRSASRVFVGSEFVRKALIEHYNVPPNKAVVSGFGAGFGFGDPYEKVFDGRTILYIGKGDFEKKGGTVLLEAFERVRAEIPQAVLHIVGQDRLPNLPGVVNHGFVRDRQKIVSLMRAAHVFTLPSLVDRNPISILEAMAAGTPCVASDYGAIPDLVGDAGLIAPCSDVAALAAALIRILRDEPLSRRLGAVGRQRFEQVFNWETVWRVIKTEIHAALAEQGIRSASIAPRALEA
jgi:glycosyltransferase involved in cell wall biosynthesis